MLLAEVFYHHRASVWGVRIQGDYVVTGSMDGTIALIDINTMQIKKHFLAHENEWGSKFCECIQKCKRAYFATRNFSTFFCIPVSDLDTSKDVIVSGCFDRLLRIWSFPDCNLRLTIDAKHAVNCVSVCKELAATCSRTGRSTGTPNVIIWNIFTGDMVRALDLPSACFVQVSELGY